MSPATCQECSCKDLEKLSPDQLRGSLKRFIDAEIEFEPPFLSALLSQHCKTLAAEDVNDFVDAVCPYGEDDEAIDVYSPKLRCIGLTKVDASALLLQTVVHEKLTPMVCQGEASAAHVLQLCQALMRMAEPARRPASLSAILGAALDEVWDVAAYFVALQSDGVGVAGTTVETLNTIKNGRKGAKALIRTAVSQTQYWKDLDSRYRSSEVKAATLTPQLQALRSRLQQDDKPAIEEVIQKSSLLEGLLATSVG